MHCKTLAFLAAALATVSAAPASLLNDVDVQDITIRSPEDEQRRDLGTFPFDRIVAFGDDFTDDSSGSWAHGLTGDKDTGAGKNLWGAKTWTDGPVAVTYMSQSLGVPIAYNYAFGSTWGGAQIGSVCSNGLLDKTKLKGHARFPGGPLVPAALQQIANYTKTGKFNKDMSKTLHFFWTGNNDMIASLGWLGRFTLCTKDTLCIPGQQVFINQLAGCFQTSLNNLIRSGAQYIVVPNIYPRSYAPWTDEYITKDDAMKANFDNVINQMNDRIKQIVTSLAAKTGRKIFYYDVNAKIKGAMQDPSLVQGAGYNYTCIDACTRQVSTTQSNWDKFWNATVINKIPNQFFWMTFVMPSQPVQQYLGNDMASFIKSLPWT